MELSGCDVRMCLKIDTTLTADTCAANHARVKEFVTTHVHMHRFIPCLGCDGPDVPPPAAVASDIVGNLVSMVLASKAKSQMEMGVARLYFLNEVALGGVCFVAPWSYYATVFILTGTATINPSDSESWQFSLQMPPQVMKLAELLSTLANYSEGALRREGPDGNLEYKRLVVHSLPILRWVSMQRCAFSPDDGSNFAINAKPSSNAHRSADAPRPAHPADSGAPLGDLDADPGGDDDDGGDWLARLLEAELDLDDIDTEVEGVDEDERDGGLDVAGGERSDAIEPEDMPSTAAASTDAADAIHTIAAACTSGASSSIGHDGDAALVVGPLSLVDSDLRSTVMGAVRVIVEAGRRSVADAKRECREADDDCYDKDISLIVVGDEVTWAYWVDAAQFKYRQVELHPRYNSVKTIVAHRVPIRDATGCRIVIHHTTVAMRFAKKWDADVMPAWCLCLYLFEQLQLFSGPFAAIGATPDDVLSCIVCESGLPNGIPYGPNAWYLFRCSRCLCPWHLECARATTPSLHRASFAAIASEAFVCPVCSSVDVP
jgi:hypothetical protein